MLRIAGNTMGTRSLISSMTTKDASTLPNRRMQSSELYQKTLADAQSQARKLLEESQERNRQDRENMLRSVRQEVADLAVAAAEKVATSSNQAIDTFLQEAGDQT